MAQSPRRDLPDEFSKGHCDLEGPLIRSITNLLYSHCSQGRFTRAGSGRQELLRCICRRAGACATFELAEEQVEREMRAEIGFGFLLSCNLVLMCLRGASQMSMRATILCLYDRRAI